MEGRRRPAEGDRRGVEDDPRHRPQDRRGAVDAVRRGPRRVRPPPRRALRLARRPARRGPRGQAGAHQGGAEAGDLHRLGPDERRDALADGPLEGGAAHRPRRRRRPLEGVPRRAGRLLRRPRRVGQEAHRRGAGQPAAEGRAARRGREARPDHRPARAPRTRCARSRSATTRSGTCPRGAMRSLEDRMQAVEQKVRGAADTARARTAPENPMVTSMRAAVTKAEEQLAKAEAAGDKRRIDEAQANLATRREWLAEAEKCRVPTLTGDRQSCPAGSRSAGGARSAACRAGCPASTAGCRPRSASPARVRRCDSSGAVGDEVVRRGVGHDGLDDVAGPDAVGGREVDQPAVAGAAGEPAGARRPCGPRPRRRAARPAGRPARGSPPS